VVALGVIAWIPAVQGQQPPLQRPPGHAEGGALGDEPGEQGHHIDSHGGNCRAQYGVTGAWCALRQDQSGSQSTVRTRASMSTPVTEPGRTNGISCSVSPPRTTTTSLAPVANRWDTRPSSSPSVFTTCMPSRSTQ